MFGKTKKFFSGYATSLDLYTAVVIGLVSFAVSAGLFVNAYHDYRHERRQHRIEAFENGFIRPMQELSEQLKEESPRDFKSGFVEKTVEEADK